MMSEETRKQRIAVLGGGFSSLAAVFALTSQPGWDERYSITVYQIGWRLGGKAASSRNQGAHDRSEERGSHLLLGFYDNTLAMLRGSTKSWGGRRGRRWRPSKRRSPRLIRCTCAAGRRSSRCGR